MANRPQTLYGLMDSPIGLAAWILDHDKDSYEIIAPAFTETRAAFPETTCSTTLRCTG